MAAFYDALETRSPEASLARLYDALPAQVDRARAHSPAYARLLGSLDPARITDGVALATLPVLRKSELAALQREAPPFGGLATRPTGLMGRVFQSPGPIYEPAARRPDYWRLARALFAAGFRAGDLIHNAFPYHFTPTGAMVDSGAAALGCCVFPAGPGDTELQVLAIADLQPNGYTGAPGFLLTLLERAAELGTPSGSLRKALVSGEPLTGGLREALRGHGVAVRQCYATADLGLIAYETSAEDGLVIDEQVIVEIVRPGTGEPLPDGEVGEVLVTTLNPDYPLIRFATGDLSSVLPGYSACGRSNRRLRGWLGRADQTTKVNGLFVHPGQIAEVLKRFPDLGRGRLSVGRVGRADAMWLRCELSGPPAPGLAERVAGVLRDITRLHGVVEFVAPGSLPNDGRLIDDVREHG